eukprot:Selendium_serpulae@DN1008_c0_g1_i1.p1
MSCPPSGRAPHSYSYVQQPANQQVIPAHQYVASAQWDNVRTFGIAPSQPPKWDNVRSFGAAQAQPNYLKMQMQPAKKAVDCGSVGGQGRGRSLTTKTRSVAPTTEVSSQMNRVPMRQNRLSRDMILITQPRGQAGGSYAPMQDVRQPNRAPVLQYHIPREVRSGGARSRGESSRVSAKAPSNAPPTEYGSKSSKKTPSVAAKTPSQVGRGSGSLDSGLNAKERRRWGVFECFRCCCKESERERGWMAVLVRPAGVQSFAKSKLRNYESWHSSR